MPLMYFLTNHYGVPRLKIENRPTQLKISTKLNDVVEAGFAMWFHHVQQQGCFRDCYNNSLDSLGVTGACAVDKSVQLSVMTMNPHMI